MEKMKAEKFKRWISGHLPKEIKYLTAIDVIIYATTGKYEDTLVPDLTAIDAIGRFGEDHDIN